MVVNVFQPTQPAPAATPVPTPRSVVGCPVRGGAIPLLWKVFAPSLFLVAWDAERLALRQLRSPSGWCPRPHVVMHLGAPVNMVENQLPVTSAVRTHLAGEVRIAVASGVFPLSPPFIFDVLVWHVPCVEIESTWEGSQPSAYTSRQGYWLLLSNTLGGFLSLSQGWDLHPHRSALQAAASLFRHLGAFLAAMLSVPLPVVPGASCLAIIALAMLRAAPASAVLNPHLRDRLLKMMWPAK